MEFKLHFIDTSDMIYPQLCSEYKQHVIDESLQRE